MSIYVIIGAWVVIFLLLFAGFYFFLSGARDIDAAHINMNHLMDDLLGKKEMTVKKVEARRRKYGSASSDGKDPGFGEKFLIMIDNQLLWSGTSIIRPWFTAQIYLIVTFVLAVVLFGLGYVTFNIAAGFLMVCVVVVVPYGYLISVTNTNYHNTEKQMKFFINLVSSNSSAGGDLLTVLERSIEYVADPIRSALIRAVSTARLTGNSDLAIQQLEREIEHPLFKNFIRNLYVSSKNNADFHSVANDYSEQADQFIAALERQRTIFSNARSEVLLMFVVGIGLSFYTAYFCERNLFEVIEEMTHSTLGMVCIFIEIAIYLSALVYMLFGRKR